MVASVRREQLGPGAQDADPDRMGDRRTGVDDRHPEPEPDRVEGIDRDGEGHEADWKGGRPGPPPPAAQGKLVRVTRGAVLDVVVDVRHGSPTFGRHIAVELSEDNWRQLWIPEGFLHGFCTLSEDVEFLYKVTAYYSPEHERGLLWSDPRLGIDWQLKGAEPLLSERDRRHPVLAELPRFFSCE